MSYTWARASSASARCGYGSRRGGVLAVLTVVLACAQPGAAQTPHLDGKLSLDPPAGLMHGSSCLSGFSPRARVRFLLSAPLNIKVVTGDSGRVIPYTEVADARIAGEAREYVVTAPQGTQPLSAFCVAYRGAVPVFDSNTALLDWKGRLVATHGTLRASEQTRWYPTVFDSATGQTSEMVTYRLHVSCATCRTIYLNGSPPVSDTSGDFVSETPRALILFAGDVGVRATPAMTYIGGRANDETASTFNAAFDRIAQYYASFLGIPYGDHPVLLSFYSVSRAYPPGQVSWQFVTWPTITFSGGVDFDQLLDRSGGAPRLPDWLWKSLSHEMGHYYFGTVHVPHGPLHWPVLESTAEYLSLRSAEHFRGALSMYASVATDLATLESKPYPPLSQTTALTQDNGYRYQVVPLYLLELDKLVGEQRMGRLLQALAQAPDSEVADYAQFARVAHAAAIPDSALTRAMTTAVVERDMMASIRRVLAIAADSADPDQTVALAASMVALDTTDAGRHQLVGLLQRVVRRDTTALGAYYLIGKIGAITGHDLDQAAEALQHYLRVPEPSGGPSHAAAHWRLGMIAARRGDVRRARAEYQRALDADPTLTEARQALQALETMP